MTGARVLPFGGDVAQWRLRAGDADFLGYWRDALHGVGGAACVVAADGVPVMGFVPVGRK